MGQAQRSDGRNVLQGREEGRRAQYPAQRRRKQNGTRNRTGNAYRNSARDGLSVIAGSRASGGAQRSSAGERAGQQGKNSDGLENLELWEISRESDDSRMMRLANREQIRFDQRRTRPRPQPGRQNTGNPRPVSSVKRRRAKKRRLNVYRISIFLIIGVCLILIYQTIGAVYRMVHNEEAGTGKGIVEVVSEKIEANRIQPPPIIVDYLEPNDFSRPGTELKRIKSVFVHYTANPVGKRAFYHRLRGRADPVYSAGGTGIRGCDEECGFCFHRVLLSG